MTPRFKGEVIIRCRSFLRHSFRQLLVAFANTQSPFRFVRPTGRCPLNLPPLEKVFQAAGSGGRSLPKKDTTPFRKRKLVYIVQMRLADGEQSKIGILLGRGVGTLSPP